MEAIAQACVAAVTQVIDNALGPQTIAGAITLVPSPQMPRRLAVPDEVLSSEAAAAMAISDGRVERGAMQPVVRQIQVRAVASSHCRHTSHIGPTHQRS